MWPEPKPNQPLERPYFSPRQLVTAADLNAGVAYLVERARRHNRYLHGCGIACGMEVDVSHDFDPDQFHLELTFTINEGAAISPRGDTIVMEASQVTFNQVIILDDEEEALTDLVFPGMTEPVVVYLLVRHTGTIHLDHQRPTFADECRHSNNGVSPTRLVEGYEFVLTTVLGSGCARPSPQLCGEDGSPLNRRSPEHEEALMRLMSCPPADASDEWLVVATVILQVGTAEQLITTLHYRDRTLLPSAQALLALLGCFREVPRIDDVTVTRTVGNLFGTLVVVYVVRVTGFGLTPLAGVEVEEIDPERVFVDLSQANHREIVFAVLSLDIAGSSTHRFHVETEFDVIHSADCGVSLDLSSNLPPEPSGLTPDGPIGGGNL